MPRKTKSATTPGTESGTEPDAGPAATVPSEGFRPFADAAAVRNLGALSFENGTTRIAIHGALDLTRDRAGLERARTLKATVDAIVAALEGQDLPDAIAEEAQAARTVENPFA